MDRNAEESKQNIYGTTFCPDKGRDTQTRQREERESEKEGEGKQAENETGKEMRPYQPDRGAKRDSNVDMLKGIKIL